MDGAGSQIGLTSRADQGRAIVTGLKVNCEV